MNIRFFGMMRKQCRRFLYDYAEACTIPHPFNRENKMAGEDWLGSFMKKYKLSHRVPEATTIATMIGFNKLQVGNFFEVLRDVRERYKFPAGNIYNADESGLSTVPTKDFSK